MKWWLALVTGIVISGVGIRCFPLRLSGFNLYQAQALRHAIRGGVAGRDWGVGLMACYKLLRLYVRVYAQRWAA